MKKLLLMLCILLLPINVFAITCQEANDQGLFKITFNFERYQDGDGRGYARTWIENNANQNLNLSMISYARYGIDTYELYKTGFGTNPGVMAMAVQVPECAYRVEILCDEVNNGQQPFSEKVIFSNNSNYLPYCQPEQQVPEFTTIGIIAAVIGVLGLIIIRKK